MIFLGNKYGACGIDYYRLTFRELCRLLFGGSVEVDCTSITLWGRKMKAQCRR